MHSSKMFDEFVKTDPKGEKTNGGIFDQTIRRCGIKSRILQSTDLKPTRSMRNASAEMMDAVVHCEEDADIQAIAV